MSRIVIAVAFAVALLGAAGTARADEGNPNFRSDLRSVEPSVPGLEVEVVEGDDALELRNETGNAVFIPGYEGEPYLRISEAGVVEVNVNSPSKYLNADRFAETKIPATADPKAPPSWQVIGRDGIVEWHDHRIHWMSKTALPPQVKDEHEDTKIFDWKVPMTVGDREVVASGTLFWDPIEGEDAGGFPVAAVAGGAAGGALFLAAAAVLWLRRRPRKASETPAREVW